MRSKQFYRYYQAIGLFNTVIPTFSPDSVKDIILKINPVANIFYYSCSKNVLNKYLTDNISDKKIKSPIKNSRNSYVSSVSLYDLQDFDKVSSSSLFINENFFIPDEVISQQKLKTQLWSQFNNSMLNHSLITIKIMRQILTKITLYLLFSKGKLK